MRGQPDPRETVLGLIVLKRVLSRLGLRNEESSCHGMCIPLDLVSCVCVCVSVCVCWSRNVKLNRESSYHRSQLRS